MPSLSKLSRLAWTVRYLKARQITEQVRHRVVRSFERNGNGNGRAVMEYLGCAWPNGSRFLASGDQNKVADAIRRGALQFLNSEVKVGFPPTWYCPDLPKLWQYNLHYFEWLWALAYQDAKAVVSDWIEKHPPARASVGWEPYPTSVRLMNWCAVFWGKFRKNTENDKLFMKKLWASICQQSEWLKRHLETHLLGNHYLENGAALAFVGSCINGKQPQKWLEKGCSILKEQLAEQVLSDGMHFERSPMYHLRVTYLLAMLTATGNKELIQMVKEPLNRMLKAINCICHPDGKIALLNDSAFGIYNKPNELWAYCYKLLGLVPHMLPSSKGCFALQDSGYYGWQDDEGNYLICDFGKIGPDYIPGHSHADMFSFELSLKSHRVIVDSGVYDYEPGQMRDYCRSTKAHNTVDIDGQDQCEMWAAFRVARRGYPYDVKWLPDKNGFQVSGWHDGYKRLKGKPVHHREFTWHNSGILTVKDRIIASCPKNIISRLHLHPDCSIVELEVDFVLINYPAGKLMISFSGGSNLSVEDSFYCPEFGMKLENKALAYYAFGNDINISMVIKGV